MITSTGKEFSEYLMTVKHILLDGRIPKSALTTDSERDKILTERNGDLLRDIYDQYDEYSNQ